MTTIDFDTFDFTSIENEIPNAQCQHTETYYQRGLKICKECGMECCEHKETEEIDGIQVCMHCSEEIKGINYEQDWRYYGGNKQDPTRCHKRQVATKSLYSYTNDKQFVTSILDNANQKYVKIKSESQQGKNNKALIVACIYAAYLDEKEPKTSAEIGKKFGLNKKNISKGFDIFYKHFPEYRTKYIEATDLIRRVLIKTGIHMSHYPNIYKLCKYIQSKSNTINRSTPQSIAASIVYLYICLRPSLKNGLTKATFTKKVGMSEITISKICKQSLKILNKEDIKL